MGIHIQYILHSLFLIFDAKCGGDVWGGGGGGVYIFFIRKTILSHFIFSSRFMLFPTFIERKQNSGGGECVNKICGVSC